MDYRKNKDNFDISIKNNRDLELFLEQSRILIQQRIAPFANDTREKQEKRIERAENDLEFFARTYFPSYVSDKEGEYIKPPIFWKEVHKELEKRSKNYVVLCTPPEHGKSVDKLIYKIHQGIFEKRHYIVSCTITHKLSIKVNVGIRAHFEVNPRLIHDFGNLESAGMWEKENFVLKNGVQYEAHGIDTPFRMMMQDALRPDLVDIDDITGIKSARNKALEWGKVEIIRQGVFGRLSDTGTIWWTGNVISPFSAIYQFEKAIEKEREQGILDNDVFYRRYPAIFPDGQTLWPARYTKADIEKKMKKSGNIGGKRVFLQIPVMQGKFYDELWMNKFDISDAPKLWEQMDFKVMYIDPSFGKKVNDKRVCVVMGARPESKSLESEELRLEKFRFDAVSTATMSTNDFYNAVCRMYQKWNPGTPLMYEGNFHQEDVVAGELRRAQKRTNIYFPIKAYFNYDNKFDRIERGSGECEAGLWYFCKGIPGIIDVINTYSLYCGQGSLDYYDPADCDATASKILDEGIQKEVAMPDPDEYVPESFEYDFDEELEWI